MLARGRVDPLHENETKRHGVLFRPRMAGQITPSAIGQTEARQQDHDVWISGADEVDIRFGTRSEDRDTRVITTGGSPTMPILMGVEDRDSSELTGA